MVDGLKKRTHCPKCNGSLKRIERVVTTGHGWVKKFFIIYKCDDCLYENKIDLQITGKLKRRLQKKIKGASFNG
jgi:C4-type Zn-finger protein